MKPFSKLASPAGFALVLLLFLFLPFLSVSCEVPGMGTIGADYTGRHLVTGAEPEAEVPAELRDLGDELPGGGGENSEPPPDPGVQVLAIIAALVMLGGIATPLIPRLRHRLAGSAGIAVLAAVLVVVTQVIAQSKLTDQLLEDAEDLGDGQSDLGLPDADEIAEQMIRSEVGFWLTLVGLLLIALISAGVLAKDRIIRRPTPTGPGIPLFTDPTTPPPPGHTEPGEAGPPPQGEVAPKRDE